MFNADIPTIPENFNLCKLTKIGLVCININNLALFNFYFLLFLCRADGSHPFYMEMRKGGLAHGVFLRNSDPMDVILSDNALQYKIIGGKLIFYSWITRTKL